MQRGKPNKRYSPEFKKLVAETMQKGRLSYSETTRNFSISSVGRGKDWERIYLTEGPEGLAVERRGRGSKRHPPFFQNYQKMWNRTYLRRFGIFVRRMIT